MIVTDERVFVHPERRRRRRRRRRRDHRVARPIPRELRLAHEEGRAPVQLAPAMVRAQGQEARLVQGRVAGESTGGRSPEGSSTSPRLSARAPRRSATRAGRTASSSSAASRPRRLDASFCAPTANGSATDGRLSSRRCATTRAVSRRRRLCSFGGVLPSRARRADPRGRRSSTGGTRAPSRTPRASPRPAIVTRAAAARSIRTSTSASPTTRPGRAAAANAPPPSASDPYLQLAGGGNSSNEGVGHVLHERGRPVLRQLADRGDAVGETKPVRDG